jgi:hypothetical protein
VGVRKNPVTEVAGLALPVGERRYLSELHFPWKMKGI